ncbi:MAG: DUF6531 domain-containing protein [Pseudonocardiaceae bacterium]
MSISSARPDDLDSFATGSRAADQELQTARGTLLRLLAEFQDRTDWGLFDPSSLLEGFRRYIELNEVDAQWVATIAETFRRAGGDGSLARLPDAAIAASLRAAGLDGTRESVAYMDPIAFGAPPTTGYANDPVNTASGNFVDFTTDLPFSGLLQLLNLTRAYNSRSDRDDGPFGVGWSCWASARLLPRSDGAEYEGPDGQRALFPRMGAGYGRVVGVNAQVEVLEAGLALQWFDGRRWEFDDAGRPRLVSQGPGTDVCFRYDDHGRLAGLQHCRGRDVEVTWDGPRIAGLSCSDGRVVCYRYDEPGNLAGADGPAGPKQYAVDEHGRVVSVSDADGVIAFVNTYDEHGRVTEQLSPFGRRTSFGYLPGNVTVTADDSGGPMSTYIHDRAGRLVTVIDGHGQRFTKNYDDWGNPVAIIERNGAVTVQEWDDRARLLRRTLPSGAAFSFSYDDADRLVAVAASTGAETRYRYEGAQRSPSEIVDPEGGRTRLAVAAGLVHEVTDPDGVTVRFEFDRDGNLVAATDGEGNTARIERDDAGRPVVATSPSGRRTTFDYNAAGLLSSRRGPAGDHWRYEYSLGGRPTAVVDPTGARTAVSYGPHGEPTEFVDPLGGTTARRYDMFGNVVGATAADGAKWEYCYDALMRLTAHTDPAGATWLREYDVAGNLTGSIDPTGIHYTATVDQSGRVTALNDGLTSSAFEFDELGRTLAHRRPDGTELRATYDRCGRRTSVLDPHGELTRYEYTPGGRVQRVVAPSGRAETFEYDRCGQATARIDAAGRRWEYRYDADGALVERVAPTGEAETFTYDAGGRVAQWSAPGSGTTTYSYDATGRVVAVTDRLAGSRRFGYDPAGRLIEAVDAGGGTTRYTYNSRGFLVSVVDPLGGLTTLGYDEVGRLLSETDPLGRVSTFAYDAAGRLLQRVDGDGARVRWSYDVSGRVRTLGGGSSDDPQISITRDGLGRPVRIGEPGRQCQELRWDRSGRLIERRRGELAMRWRYDADGRRCALGYPDGSETAYTSEKAGRTVAMDHPLLGRVRLDRDPVGRLVGLHGDGMSATWRYDAGDLVGYDLEHGGTRRATRLTRDATGRISSVSVDGQVRHYGYDPAGQLVSVTGPQGEFSFDYDANGRLVREAGPGGLVEYGHDAAGQLTSARRAGGGECHFEYDGAGRRVREVRPDVDRSYHWDWLGRLTGVDTVRPDGAARSTRLVVDALGELAEVDGTTLMWDTADPMAPLTWLGQSAVIGDGRPWAVVSAAAHAAGEDPWLDRNWQGTGGVEPSDPWGTGAGSPVGDLQLGFGGELTIDGLVWLRNRAYDPATRSFLLPDPRPPVPGTAYAANPYHYAGNDPINLADPLGLRPVTDAELQRYRDQMDRNLWERGADWMADNWEYVAAGAMIVGGVALMCTGIGGPAGVALMAGSGALISAGASTAIQKFSTGEVDWGRVAVDGAMGAVAGGAGGAAALGISRTAFVASRSPAAQALIIGGTESIASGAAGRGFSGSNPLDPKGMAQDLLTGGRSNGVGGRLGELPPTPAARIPDDAAVVRGGTADLPAPGEVFSGSSGSNFDEAARGVPHGQVRQATVGDVRAGGGSVEYAPEYDTRVEKTNYQHVDVSLGPRGSPFGELEKNPWSKKDRWGGENYPYADEG